MYSILKALSRSSAVGRAPLRLSAQRVFHSSTPLEKISGDVARTILGLKAEFTKAELKRAFVAVPLPSSSAKAKEVHPDVNPSPQATERFAAINEAFQILEAEADSSIKMQSEKVQTKDEKLEEDLEREFAAFRDWTVRRKRDRELDLKKRQQSIMWLLTSAVGVLIMGQALQSFFDVYPFESSLKKMWGSRYEELLADYNKANAKLK